MNDLIGDPQFSEQANRLLASLHDWMQTSGDPMRN